jgi:hypothetical protein
MHLLFVRLGLFTKLGNDSDEMRRPMTKSGSYLTSILSFILQIENPKAREREFMDLKSAQWSEEGKRHKLQIFTWIRSGFYYSILDLDLVHCKQPIADIIRGKPTNEQKIEWFSSREWRWRRDGGEENRRNREKKILLSKLSPIIWKRRYPLS